ncbi:MULTISPECIES: hypothetical protein [Aliiglaciecola]|uniref:hypothetical protein n=1 Tax=Aliiglaciecola TaxID=1406885 RepID=UPI001C092A25|nr:MULTISPECIES: hypothetical protein [Aliiglaciecola]MBU2879465.1 hypothetical protein [Aliiglaciecola lipolytica]MDO6712507.1 hypothetical protein [Aliiglaciecola sp. 2_MG-2023]MDO6753435.1 hypothetical protein [Aliiglaciecola sp. 1_MG-2023]
MENPYSAPKSDMGQSLSTDSTSIFSPNQITLGAFIGGPLAAVYFLYQNFSALNQFDKAQQTLRWGLSLCLVFICLLPIIPENFPNTVIPIVYCIVARQIAEKHQCSKQQIIESDLFRFQSNWRVLVITVTALILLMVLVIPVIFAFEMFSA